MYINDLLSKHCSISCICNQLFLDGSAGESLAAHDGANVLSSCRSFLEEAAYTEGCKTEPESNAYYLSGFVFALHWHVRFSFVLSLSLCNSVTRLNSSFPLAYLSSYSKYLRKYSVYVKINPFVSQLYIKRVNLLKIFCKIYVNIIKYNSLQACPHSVISIRCQFLSCLVCR